MTRERFSGFLVGLVLATLAYQLMDGMTGLRLQLHQAVPLLRDIRSELLRAAAGAKDE